MLSFEFDGCTEILHEGVVHACPTGDSQPHSVEGCNCGYEELRLGDTVLAVLHRPWDKRDLVDALYEVDTPEEGHILREEFIETNKNLLREGKLDEKGYWEKWLVFESTYQEIFQTN